MTLFTHEERLLPVPAVRPTNTRRVEGLPVVFTGGHHFAAVEGTEAAVAEAASGPLSVIVQVTKRCQFDCTFCSETPQRPDPTLEDLAAIAGNLAGVPRVFLSGGEPLLRRDLREVVEVFDGFLIGLPTNAVRALAHASALVGKVAFVNVGLEGPRAVTSRVRGDYDQILTGIRAFQQAGLPLSLSALVYRSTLTGLPFL